MNNSIYFKLLLLDKNHNKHYIKRYVKLVSFYKERNFNKAEGVLQQHHIIPDSVDEENSNENIIYITSREHFILHWILSKAFPNSIMVIIFKSMCFGLKHYDDNKSSSKVYENLMIEFGEMTK